MSQSFKNGNEQPGTHYQTGCCPPDESGWMVHVGDGIEECLYFELPELVNNHNPYDSSDESDDSRMPDLVDYDSSIESDDNVRPDRQVYRSLPEEVEDTHTGISGEEPDDLDTKPPFDPYLSCGTETAVGYAHAKTSSVKIDSPKLGLFVESL